MGLSKKLSQERFSENHGAKKFRNYLEPMLNRQHERLQSRLARLQNSIEGYAGPYHKIKKHKMARKAEKLIRKSEMLEEFMKSGNEPPEKLAKPDQDFGGKWIKEDDNDVTILPPAYEEIFPQQPPPYNEVHETRSDHLYPTLT